MKNNLWTKDLTTLHLIQTLKLIDIHHHQISIDQFRNSLKNSLDLRNFPLKFLICHYFELEPQDTLIQNILCNDLNSMERFLKNIEPRNWDEAYEYQQYLLFIEYNHLNITLFENHRFFRDFAIREGFIFNPNTTVDKLSLKQIASWFRKSGPTLTTIRYRDLIREEDEIYYNNLEAFKERCHDWAKHNCFRCVTKILFDFKNGPLDFEWLNIFRRLGITYTQFEKQFSCPYLQAKYIKIIHSQLTVLHQISWKFQGINCPDFIEFSRIPEYEEYLQHYNQLPRVKEILL
jgi:hypothetical protein